VLLDRFNIALNHAIRLWVQVCGARLAHSQALQNLYQTGQFLNIISCQGLVVSFPDLIQGLEDTQVAS
jgi:hypothetical protein